MAVTDVAADVKERLGTQLSSDVRLPNDAAINNLGDSAMYFVNAWTKQTASLPLTGITRSVVVNLTCAYVLAGISGGSVTGNLSYTISKLTVRRGVETTELENVIGLFLQMAKQELSVMGRGKKFELSNTGGIRCSLSDLIE